MNSGARESTEQRAGERGLLLLGVLQRVPGASAARRRAAAVQRVRLLHHGQSAKHHHTRYNSHREPSPSYSSQSQSDETVDLVVLSYKSPVGYT